MVLFVSSFLPVLMIVGVIVFLVVMAKKGRFSTKAAPQITLREGEVSILATQVVWMQKKLYLNKYSIPHGVLDITNQRVVYTRVTGDKVDFALEKSEIAAVTLRGKLGVTIRAKDGTSYVINTIPAKKTAEALAQLGIPVEG